MNSTIFWFFGVKIGFFSTKPQILINFTFNQTHTPYAFLPTPPALDTD
jgi:hypothetical protein